MTVAELIAALQGMPETAQIGMLWDSADRTDVEAVWLAASGRVIVGELGEHVDFVEDRIANGLHVPAWAALTVGDMLGIDDTNSNG